MESLPLKSSQDRAVGESLLPDHLRGHEAAIDSLRATGQMLHARGWSVGTSSNYSLVVRRNPLELLVTASGMDKGNLLPSHFVRVDADGKPVVEGQPKSSAETLLHCILAKQPDVGAVLHTHSVWSTVLSGIFFEDGGLEVEGFEMLKGLEGIQTHQQRIWVPIFDNTQDIPSLAADIEERSLAGNSPVPHGFLIRQHGLYTWGRDLFAARRHIEIFEFLFECVAQKMILQNSLPAFRASLS